MTALFTHFLIVTNHIAHGLFNLHLIPLVTIGLVVWSLNRILRDESSSPRSFGFVQRFLPWSNLLCFLIKPANPVDPLPLLSHPLLFRVLYPITLSPVWIRAFTLRKRTVLLAAGALVFYLLSIHSDPRNAIDVFTSNNLGLDYLSKGLNPYAQAYPPEMADIYGYRAGFLYWPGTIYLEGASRFLFGDLRVILALLWWVAPFFFDRRPSGEENLALKAAWWFLPFLNFCLRCAWIDPILAFSAALLLFSLRRQGLWLASFAIALAASVKQYGGLLGVFAVPYVFLTADRKTDALKLTLRSATIFAVLMLPFLVWNLHAFIDMTLLSHLEAKTRLDALNFTAWWIRVTGLDFPGRVQGIMTLCGFTLALWHLLRNAKKTGLRVLPEAWAIAFGFSVVFGKFGFANYYWLWISFLLLALTLERPAKTSDGSGS